MKKILFTVVFCCHFLSIKTLLATEARDRQVALQVESEAVDKQDQKPWSESTSGRIKLFFAFLTKLGIDAFALYQVLDQMDALDGLSEALRQDTSPCQGVCQSNMDHFVTGRKNSYIVSCGTAFTTSLTVLADCWGIKNVIYSGKDWESPLAFSMAGSGFSFITGLWQNAYLWNLSFSHQDQIPEPITEALSKAISEGLYPLIANGIIGLPGSCVLLVASCRGPSAF